MRTIYQVDENGVATGRSRILGPKEGRKPDWVVSQTEPPAPYARWTGADWEQLPEYPQKTITREEWEGQVRKLARGKRDSGVVVNGLLVGTDSEARSLLLAGKVNGKASRKIVTKKGRGVVTGEQMNAVVEAVDDYVQAVMDKEYDLLELGDATPEAELGSIDLFSGWPSTGQEK